MRSRKAKYAGAFYPSDADSLSAQIAELLLLSKAEHLIAKMLLVPSDQSLYTGMQAATAFRSLQFNSHLIKHVVLVTQNTKAPAYSCIVSNYDEFETPLGSIMLDEKTIKSLSLSPNVYIANEFHSDSLTMELNLPFLQICLLDFKLVPVVVGPKTVDQLVELLSPFLMRPDCLIVFALNWSKTSIKDIEEMLSNPEKFEGNNMIGNEMLAVLVKLIFNHQLDTHLISSPTSNQESCIAAIIS